MCNNRFDRVEPYLGTVESLMLFYYVILSREDNFVELIVPLHAHFHFLSRHRAGEICPREICVKL